MITLKEKQNVKNLFKKEFANDQLFDQHFDQWYAWVVKKDGTEREIRVESLIKGFRSFSQSKKIPSTNVYSVERNQSSSSIEGQKKEGANEEKHYETFNKGFECGIKDNIYLWGMFFKNNLNLKYTLERFTIYNLWKYYFNSTTKAKLVVKGLFNRKDISIYRLQDLTDIINLATEEKPVQQSRSSVQPVYDENRMITKSVFDQIEKNAIQLENEMDELDMYYSISQSQDDYLN